MWRICRFGLAFSLGVAWGVCAGQQLVDMQLPEEWVGQDFLVTGQIQGLPKHDDHRQRFALRVHTATTQTGDKIALDKFPRKIQLSWYQRPAHQVEASTTDLAGINVLRIKLKPPRPTCPH
jgi:predicted membrane metal-binding protein